MARDGIFIADYLYAQPYYSVIDVQQDFAAQEYIFALNVRTIGRITLRLKANMVGEYGLNQDFENYFNRLWC